MSGVIRSISSPYSSLICVAPVTAAMSSKKSFFQKLNPGGATTFTFILPLILFITTALIGCFSNSPIINKALLFATAYSNTVCIFLIVDIGDETSSTKGFSNVTFCLATSVIKFGFAKP